HGGGGADFMDGTVDAYLKAAEFHARHGTTSMVPTASASMNEELRNMMEIFKTAKAENSNGAELLGLHLEGPYLCLGQKGAQDSRYVKNPKPSEYEEISSWSDDIIMWGAAPELEGSLEFGRCITKKGIRVSIAHSDATYEEVLNAFESGFRHVTHLYSCTSGVRRINAYRYAGIIESAYLIDDMTVELIADGAHLPASLLKLAYKIKGPDRIALVTDSIRAAGLPEGEYMEGSLENGQKIIIEDGVAKLPDRSAFAGSVATTDRLVRTMVKTADVPVVEAVRMMTKTPAAIIGADKTKGILAAGKDADIVIFDDNINIKMTIIKGRIIYKCIS
ncbi:MAG: N-acetylglucosamine-6-phosphate deacetylase, partial [Clostridiales bacterium]|nr:N-acetylglucosamine-6-phosphate deacetylase [Clostridiales bacterium]